jgi:hypothetical protein
MAWAWCLFVITALLSWRTLGGRPAAGVLAVSMAAAVALAAPLPLTLLASGVFWGLIAGWLGRCVAPPHPKPLPGKAPRAAGIELVLIISALLAGAADAAESEPLLIPLDAAGNMVGRKYYVTETLWRELYRRDAARPDAIREWLLVEATYRAGLAPVADLDKITVEHLQVILELDILKADTTVNIPFEILDAHWSVGRCQLDGRALDLKWEPGSRSLAVHVGASGPCRLTMEMVPAAEHSGPTHGFHFSIPPVPCSRLVLEVPTESARMALSHLPGRIQQDLQRGRIVSDLGPTGDLLVGHPKHRLDGSQTTCAEVSDFYWLAIRPGSMQLTARFRISAGEISSGRIVLETDPRLRLLPVPEDSTYQILAHPGPPQQIAVQYSAEPGGVVTVDLPFAVRDASGVGQIHLPTIELVPRRDRKRPFALSIDPSLQYEELESRQLDPLSINDFMRLWGTAESQPALAYEIPRRFNGPLLSVGPLPPRATGRSEVETTFGSQRARIRFHSQVLISEGAWQMCRIDAPADFSADSVVVRGGSTEHRVRWSRDAAGRITILWDEPAAGPLDIEVIGFQPLERVGQCALPQFKLIGCQVAETTHAVFRNRDVLVELPALSGISDRSSMVGEQGDLDRRLVARLPANASGQTIPVQVTPNTRRADGNLMSRIEQDAGRWVVRCEWKVQVHEGAIDELLLEVPEDFDCETAPNEDFIVVSRGRSADPKRRLVALRPRQALVGTHRLQFHAELKGADGQPPEIPCLTPLAPDSTEHHVILPLRTDDRQFAWDTSGLTAGIAEAVSDQGPPGGSWRRFRVTKYPYAAASRVVSPADSRTVIRLADVRVVVRSAEREQWLALLDIHPAGDCQCEVVLPDRSQLQYLTLESRPVVAHRMDPSRWRVHLLSTSAPQRLEVMFSRPRDDRRLREWAPPQVLVEGKLVEVHDLLWTLHLPETLRLESSGRARMAAADQQEVRLRAAAASLDRALELGMEGPTMEDLPWLRVWTARLESLLLEGENGGARRGGLKGNMQQGQQGNAEAVYRRAMERLRRLEPGTVASAQPSCSELFNRFLCERTVAFQFAVPRGASGSLATEVVSAVQWANWPWHLAALLSVVLGPLAVALRQHWDAVREGYARWPMLFVMAAGLAWWLCLSPGVYGWFLIAAALLFALARRPRFWYSTARP